MKTESEKAVLSAAEVAIVAEQIARKAHEGQTRFDGSPYIAHPERVAAMCAEDPWQNAAAWLHDVLEDTPLRGRDLLEAGIPRQVVERVQALTRDIANGEPYEAFILRAKANPFAARIKVADILDNLGDSPSRKQIRKYAAALKTLLFAD